MNTAVRTLGIAAGLTALALTHRAFAREPDRPAHARKRDAAEIKQNAGKPKADMARKRAEEAKVKRDETKTRAENRKKELADKAEDRIAQRQENQNLRIQHGIRKGYLTDDEIAKLNAQQTSIVNLESTLKADGHLSRNDFQQIKTALNTASHCIWAEKHDTEGNPMPVYRLGQNVFAKTSLTDRLANEDLSPAEARAILGDFRRTVELKKTLATADLSDAERAELQAEFETLLNTYFERRS